MKPSRWVTSTRIGPARQNCEVQESESSFGRGKRVKKSSSKGREYKCLRLRIRGSRDCIVDI